MTDIREKVERAQTVGDDDLRAARVALIALWMRDAKRIRKHYVVFYDSLLKFLKEEYRFDTKDTRMLSTSVEQLERKIAKSFPIVMQQADEAFRQNVKKAIWRASRVQVQYLAKKGATVPSEAELQFLRDDVLLSLDREFPVGSGITYRNRMARMHAKHQEQLLKIGSSTHIDDAQKRIITDVETALLHVKPQRTPVAGGSLSKDMMRLVASEETRLSNEIELRVLRSSGIELAHWRLSASHPWYGGQEICELHASQVNIGLEYTLRDTEFSDVPLEGLYRLSQWPSYPHPWCRCFPEAVLP